MGHCTSLAKDDEERSVRDIIPEDELILQTFYVQSLATASYIVGSRLSGQCVIIDPRRDIDEYLLTMEEEELTCAAVFLTHLHSDFVSGYAELCERFECPVICNDDVTHAAVRHVGDDFVFALSDVYSLSVLLTPGHTPGSLCFVLESNQCVSAPTQAVFTGDTLIPGGVGCVDTCIIAAGTEEQEYYLSCLYQSFHEVILGSFKGKVALYSSHGYGSHHLPPTPDTSTWQSTIDDEQRSNHAAFLTNVDRFMQFVACSTTQPTLCSRHIVELNRRGAPSLTKTFEDVPKLNPMAFATRLGMVRELDLDLDLDVDVGVKKTEEDSDAIETEEEIDDDEAAALLKRNSIPLPTIKHESSTDTCSRCSRSGSHSISEEEVEIMMEMKCESEEDELLAHGYDLKSQQLRTLANDVLAQDTIRRYGIPRTILLDMRQADSYAAAHIPGAINVPVGTSRGILLSQWEGRVELLLSNLLTQYCNIYLIGDGRSAFEGGMEFECMLRLSRIGLDECVIGICDGGFNAWTGCGCELPIEMTPRLHINTQNDWRSVLKSYRIFDLNEYCDKIKNHENGSSSPVSVNSLRLSSSPMMAAAPNQSISSSGLSTPNGFRHSHRGLAKVASCPDLYTGCKNKCRKKIWRSVNNCPFIGNPFVWKVGLALDKSDRYALCDSHDWNATVYASILRSCGITVCDIAGGLDLSDVNVAALNSRNNLSSHVHHAFANHHGGLNSLRNMSQPLRSHSPASGMSTPTNKIMTRNDSFSWGGRHQHQHQHQHHHHQPILPDA